MDMSNILPADRVPQQRGSPLIREVVLAASLTLGFHNKQNPAQPFHVTASGRRPPPAQGMGTTQGVVKFSLPHQTACLSFLSSPAARAQGNEEDALSPQARSWVSGN